MANVLDKTKVTTFRSGDGIYVPNADNTDQYMLYTDLATFIEETSAATWTTATVADGVTGVIPLGAVASYHGFDVLAIIGYSTNRATLSKSFVYDGSSAKDYSPQIKGTLDKSVINVNMSAVQAGQFYWKIKNESGELLTVKYRITNQYPAI